jgi:Tol biopolymer transport system component
MEMVCLARRKEWGAVSCGPWGIFWAAILSSVASVFASPARAQTSWIGYTEGRNDFEEGQYANWVTQRAWRVQADGSQRQAVAAGLVVEKDQWTQFAGWSPDGAKAIVGLHRESRENARWEREHRTFRMTEGWQSDAYLVSLADGELFCPTSVDRVSACNTGLFYLPKDRGFGFTPLIDGISKPFVMDLDGRNKRDLSGASNAFSYGYSISPDGQCISYHADYQVYIADAQGEHRIRISDQFPFQFAPRWSPDGQWLLFVAGEHYDCHPHVVRRDGTGLRKVADRGGYRGVVEVLKHPDFHSESSDLPVWGVDSKTIFFTAQIEGRIELMRADLEGNVQRLTFSSPGVRHYHPAASPDGKAILFGSDRTGQMQLYVRHLEEQQDRPITEAKPGFAAMHGHWQPQSPSPPPVLGRSP